MSTAQTLDDYLKVKTAKDLIDLGVVPKTSSEHMALITSLLLEAWRDKIKSDIRGDMLGSWIPLAIKDGVDYNLAPGVVADTQVGHKFVISQDMTVTATSNEGVENRINLIKGTQGYLQEISNQGRARVIKVKFDSKLDGRQVYNLKFRDVAESMQASSLGQELPQEEEGYIYNKTLESFFPRTSVESKRARRVLISLISGNDLVLYGPRGSGKSQMARDIVDIAKLQGLLFVVDSCRVQCNPASLIDPNFAKKVPPCPECMIKYDPDFKRTGRFKSPKPEDVQVRAVSYTQGCGIEKMAGDPSLRLMHFAGFKIPKLDGSTDASREDHSSPEGFNPGKVPRTNNGILLLEEMDKLGHSKSFAPLLEALADGTLQPEDVRWPYPANNLIIGTANDHLVIPPEINDRMALIAVRYPEDVATSHMITRKAYHGEATDLNSVSISDTQKMNNAILRRIPMPLPYETAVDALYLKIRNEFKGKGNNETTSSNRSKINALDAARAALLIDKTFYKSAPRIVTPQYVMEGINFALCSRVQIASRDEEQAAKQELVDFVKNTLPVCIQEEENTFWCQTLREMAVLKTRVSNTLDRFSAELRSYEKSSSAPFENYSKLQESFAPKASSTALKSRVEFPFMNYLFEVHPGIRNLNEGEITDLVKYFIEIKDRSSCRVQE